MIIHTGNRTDIPAYYSNWFVNRLRAGEVCVRNPYNPTSVTRYKLNPDLVDLIVFCTKNPSPMIPYLDELEGYGQYWYVTITNYEQDIEPHVPLKEKVMEDFITISKRLGISRVGWRYDPIFISDKYTVEKHIADFGTMCKVLAGHTDTCVISFIDLYQKVVKNFPEVREVGRDDRIRLVKAFVEIGSRYGITIKACGEGIELAEYGVDCSGCMTQEVYERALDCSLNVPKTKGARTECGCLLGGDIGAYNTCGHMCRYCYANYDEKTVRENMKNHNPSSPLLIGNITSDDVVHEAKQESWKDMQMRLW